VLTLDEVSVGDGTHIVVAAMDGGRRRRGRVSCER